MCSGPRAAEIISSWLKDWGLYTIDFDDLSRGLLTACNPLLKVVEVRFFNSCILLKVKERLLHSDLILCNVYGPYINKCAF